MGPTDAKRHDLGVADRFYESATSGRSIRDHEHRDNRPSQHENRPASSHRTIELKVAIKILPADWMIDEAPVSRCHREIQAVAQLPHPNLLQAQDAVEEKWYALFHDGIRSLPGSRYDHQTAWFVARFRRR